MNTATSSGKTRSVAIGFSALVVLWITSAFSVPLGKSLDGSFLSEELMFARGLFGIGTALAVARWTKRSLMPTDKNVILSGMILAISSLLFYHAIYAWGVSPVVTVIAFTPAVNALLAFKRREGVPAPVLATLVCMIAGIALALQPWKSGINAVGLVLSVFCMLTAGIGYEMWSRCSRGSTDSQKCFWYCLVLMLMAPLSAYLTCRWATIAHPLAADNIRSVALFGFVSGSVYMFGNIIPFNVLPATTASILIQVATPATVIGARFMLHERLDIIQWSGLSLTIVCACMLMWWVEEQKKNK